MSILSIIYDPHDKPSFRFSVACARYHWLAHHHEGQWSETYRQLCTISAPGAYSPGSSEHEAFGNESADLLVRGDYETERAIFDHYCDREGCAHDRLKR